MKKCICGLFFILIMVALNIAAVKQVYAQTSAEALDALESSRDTILKDRSIEEYLDRIEQERSKRHQVSVENTLSDDQQIGMDFDPNVRVYVEHIVIKDVSGLTDEEMTDVAEDYVGKDLSFKDINHIVRELNKIYVKKGYLLSRVMVPPQKIENDTLILQAKEYEIGHVYVKGNRHYSESQIKKGLALKPNHLINVSELDKNISKLNEYPDLDIDVVLEKGEVQGKTDVVLDVKDRLPIHIETAWDNYGSRFIGEDRYQVTLTHNNLTRNHDRLKLMYLQSDRKALQSWGIAYVYPINDRLDVGGGASFGDVVSGEELTALDSEGEIELYTVFASYDIVKNSHNALSVLGGFDYKNIYNEFLGVVTAKDLLRIAYLDLSYNQEDKLGQTVVSNKISRGIPNIGGGLSDTYEPNIASRFNSSGEFTKNNLRVLRINRLPLNMQMRLIGHAQWSNDALPASEQLSIGGPYNVRGYPSSEIDGDEGYTASVELSAPIYLIPSDSKVPFTKERWYDALRMVGFFDYGQTQNKYALTGLDQQADLKSAGLGLRFSLSNDFSMRLDWAQGLDGVASDGSKHQTWIKVRKEF